MRETINKKELARRLGISRSALYYQPKRPAIDLEVKTQIESVLTDHPAYGHKRIALQLKLNKKRILRVMKKFAIKPYRRRAKRPVKKTDRGKPDLGFPNLLKEIYRMVYYYNNQRIHSKLKMSPRSYRRKLEEKLVQFKINSESRKLGT